uniref:Uncharacterized protein n=1 Tax=Schlesneria paludicola TaxID=360056 RepID=A0A7C2JZ43_9PLAN
MRRVNDRSVPGSTRHGWVSLEYLREGLCLGAIVVVVLGALTSLNGYSPNPIATTLLEEQYPVYSLGCTDDGHTLWFNCFHRGLVLINLEEPSDSETLRYLNTQLVDADVSSRSPRLICTTSSLGQTRWIHDREFTAELELQPADGPISDLKTLGDGRTAVGVTNGGVITCWTWNGRGVDQRQTRTTGSLTLVETSADGAWSAIIADNFELLVYHVPTGVIERRWDVRDAHCSALAVSPDGSLIATGGKEGIVRVWNRATGQLRWERRCDNLATCALDFSMDGKWLAGGGFGRTIHLWRAADGQEEATLAAHSGTIRALSFHPDGRRLYSGGLDGRVYEWSLEQRAILRSFQ